MNLAWLHGNLLHTHNGGTRFVVDYATGLHRRHGHAVTVFCDRTSEEIRQRLQAGGVAVEEMDTTSTHSPWYWLTLGPRTRRKRRELAPRLEGEFDRVINSLFPMNLLADGIRRPHIQVCYEPFAFFYDPGFLRAFTPAQRAFFRVMAAWHGPADRAAVARMNRVVTVNRTNLEKIRRIYGREADVVYAGIDPAVHHAPDPAAREALRARHPGAPLLFHSSDLTGIKGTLPLLEVIAALRPRWPRLRLLITVYFPAEDRIQRLQRRIQELGLADTVTYLGCLPREELPMHYGSVDFLCQPSLNQPASWPLKEGMLCGTPIIGGPESEEPDGCNGIRIDVRDPAAAAEALDALFRRPREDFRLDREGLLRDYGIDACLDAFNRVIVEA
jgi:glycosyltransferase involved in cell wall biosynthesis